MTEDKKPKHIEPVPEDPLLEKVSTEELDEDLRRMRDASKPNRLSTLFLRFRGFSLLALMLFTAIGLYFAVDYLIAVPENRNAVVRNCEATNSQVAKVNEKFSQLNSIFDRSIAESKAKGEEISPEILAAYEKFKLPIELTNCKLESK